MKPCFSTLGCTERSLDEILTLANRFGIDALEVRGISDCLDNGKIPDFFPENAAATRQKFADAGVAPLILGTSCSFHDQEKFPLALQEGKTALSIASRLGFRGIRVFGNNIKGEESACIRRVCEGIRTLCEEAVDRGTEILLEVHGDFNTEARLLPVAEACGEFRNFGLIWDICHTRKTYGSNWPCFWEKFSPYIRHIHLKDIKSEILVLPGEGELPLAEMVQSLTHRGYEGYFSLEWERKWHPELPEIEEALQRFSALFS